MLTAEPYKITSNSCFLIHQDNPWDKRSMNKNVNEILKIEGVGKDLELVLDTYKDCCVQKGTDISITRVDSEDCEKRELLVKNEFQMTEISYRVSCTRDQINNAGSLQGEFVTECNTQELFSLANNMFSHGRFTEDPMIDKDISNIRYRYWISDMLEGSCNRIFMKKKGALIGFMFYEQEKNEVSLKLGGVDSRFAHLVPRFWSHVLSSFDQGTTINTVISATNTPVLNLYTHFGFRVCQALVGYHKHYKGRR
jgi:hypothetical protein